MVALMPTYRIYDEEERKNYIDPKKRELDHYAPAFRNHSNGSANKPKTNKIDENVKYEKINDNKYWGNDIDSIVDNKKDLE